MLIAKRDRTEAYEVYDDGHAVGRIVMPCPAPIFGSAARTVYLRRSPTRPVEPPARVA